MKLVKNFKPSVSGILRHIKCFETTKVKKNTYLDLIFVYIAGPGFHSKKIKEDS